MTKIDKLLKTNSQAKKTSSFKGTEFEALKRRINGICISLNRSSEDYEVSKTVTSIRQYKQQKHNRILYSEISAYVFDLTNEQKGNFVTNLELLLVESINDETRIDNDTMDIILRIYDHVHLALHQFENLKRDDDDIKSLISKNLEPVSMKFEKNLQETYKELYAQLIALIGIFTALAFLVFGSISSLDNIFSTANNMPMLKILIITSLWGICLINLIFIFIYFVSKMTKLDIEESRNIKYPVIAWCNLVLIAVFLLCSWFYYVKKMNLTEWLEQLQNSNKQALVLGGFAVILSLILFSAVMIMVNSKEKK